MFTLEVKNHEKMILPQIFLTQWCPSWKTIQKKQRHIWRALPGYRFSAPPNLYPPTSSHQQYLAFRASWPLGPSKAWRRNTPFACLFVCLFACLLVCLFVCLLLVFRCSHLTSWQFDPWTVRAFLEDCWSKAFISYGVHIIGKPLPCIYQTRTLGGYVFWCFLYQVRLYAQHRRSTQYLSHMV